MEVILLERVENLGNLGDKVNVKPGYGRNFLIPGGKAQAATADNIAAFEARRAELEKNAKGVLTAAEARKTALEAIKVTILANAGEEGKLFGSVGPADIASAVIAAGVDIEKKEVRMPEGPLREVGEFEVGIHLHTDINTSLTVIIEAE
ncbi:MAG TPA: 50S ribosomal protein L9 [Gammaproteobacteria bacterium]|nr:50S ribosomal protein L9 [Gammaproteobacteria bacterium]